jgi:hypothetical protein
MKEQKDNMLIQDMNLKSGEIFMIKDRTYEYHGVVEGSDGRLYDKIVPLAETYFEPRR